MSTADALGGVLTVRPGQARPRSIEGARPDWAETLARGRPVGAVPGVLASVYNLCGHAHRLCAGAALRAAMGTVDATTQAGADALTSPRTLQIETLREHIRRITLDWPPALAAEAAEASMVDAGQRALESCPALRPELASGDLAGTRRWLESMLLGMPASDWLGGWERDPHAWLTGWSETGAGWLARLLCDCGDVAARPALGAAPLHAHASDDALRRLAAHLRDERAFARRPRQEGACAETGTWTRLGQCEGPMVSVWLKLGARIAELARLSLPDLPGRHGQGWLAQGALNLGPGEGLAWLEMARGLLIHWAQVDGGRGAERVAAYRVLAPTEWNFHPEGAAARAIEELTSTDAKLVSRQLRAIMLAYDPCVRFTVEQPLVLRGNAHA